MDVRGVRKHPPWVNPNNGVFNILVFYFLELASIHPAGQSKAQQGLWGRKGVTHQWRVEV